MFSSEEKAKSDKKTPFRVASQMSRESMHVPETDTSKRQFSDCASTAD